MAKDKQTIVEKIKLRIRLLNWISLLVLYVALLLIFRFMYGFLEYIPINSVVTLLVMVSGLMLTGFYLTRAISVNAIRAIDNYSERFKGLLTATRNLHSIEHSDLLIKDIMERAKELTGADGGSLLIKEGENLVFKTVIGFGGDTLIGHSMPATAGIAGWVVSNGTPAIVSDTLTDNRFYSGVDELTGFRTRSVMCCPLRNSKGVIGALELVSNKPMAFKTDDEELILYLAEQAAVSLERAKFYEDEKNYEIHLTNILSNINDRIAEKRGHSRRVARYCLLIASALNLSEESKKTIYLAALLHDIGFLNMPIEEIASPLDYRPHSQIGYEMLKPINFYAHIAPIVLYHHERWDGRGYPSGLKGNAIPLESRIIAIAEAFDAMVSRHSYKITGKCFGDAMGTVGFLEAIEELKANAGTQFDPELVKVFLSNITEDAIE